MDILLRDFAPADAEACTRIFDRAWHTGHDYAERTIDRATFAKETEDERIVVAELSGALVGFVALYEPQSFVHHLYVDPKFHGRGIGRALLAHAVGLAGGSASLKCQTRNTAALSFYRGLGWTEIAAGQGEFGPWVAMRSP